MGHVIVCAVVQAPQGGMDVIFCQNLLIYFRRWRRHETLNFLARRLKPGGYLIVGPGECFGEVAFLHVDHLERRRREADRVCRSHRDVVTVR